MNKNNLKPAIVFEEFAKINEIPRPSKREEKMIAYLQNWGESHGLDTKTDETGNVIIRKPATKGMENRKTVVLQSHMDMVSSMWSLISIRILSVLTLTVSGLRLRVRHWVLTTVSAVPSSWPSSLRTM